MELRRLRETAGLTIDQVAEALRFSNSKISRIETGRISATPADVRAMAELYRVSDQERDALVRIAREAREKGWWQAYGDVPIVPAYTGMEVAAASIRIYGALIVPSLLQTLQYARAVIRAVFPELHSEEVERRVELRMARQTLLAQDDPLRVWAILDEAALRRLMGGREVMREQLDHLIEAAALSTVTLQVLPFKAGGHAGIDGAFTILGYPEPADPDIVYLEHAAGDLYLESADEIQRYALLFDHLRASALSPEESTRFLGAVANEL
jgi:transcriptional regulator with XRE-family HTH domain